VKNTHLPEFRQGFTDFKTIIELFFADFTKAPTLFAEITKNRQKEVKI